MIVKSNYRQATTGVPLPYWELRGISVGYDDMIRDKAGNVRHVAREMASSTAEAGSDLTFYTADRVAAVYDGYHEPPHDRVLPVAQHHVQLDEATSRKVAEALAAGGVPIYGLIDSLCVETVEFFKDGTVDPLVA